MTAAPALTDLIEMFPLLPAGGGEAVQVAVTTRDRQGDFSRRHQPKTALPKHSGHDQVKTPHSWVHNLPLRLGSSQADRTSIPLPVLVPSHSSGELLPHNGE